MLTAAACFLLLVCVLRGYGVVTHMQQFFMLLFIVVVLITILVRGTG